jgi:hypothetical protein
LARSGKNKMTISFMRDFIIGGYVFGFKNM